MDHRILWENIHRGFHILLTKELYKSKREKNKHCIFGLQKENNFTILQFWNQLNFIKSLNKLHKSADLRTPVLPLQKHGPVALDIKEELVSCWQQKSFPSCSQSTENNLCRQALCISLMPLKAIAKHCCDSMVISIGHNTIHRSGCWAIICCNDFFCFVKWECLKRG